MENRIDCLWRESRPREDKKRYVPRRQFVTVLFVLCVVSLSFIPRKTKAGYEFKDQKKTKDQPSAVHG